MEYLLGSQMDGLRVPNVFADDRGYLPIHYLVESLSRAEEQQDALYLFELFTSKWGPSCGLALTKTGDTLLHLATSPLFADWIVWHYPMLCHVRNKQGVLPPYCATKGFDHCIVEMVVWKNKFPDILKSYDRDGLLPFHRVILYQMTRHFVDWNSDYPLPWWGLHRKQAMLTTHFPLKYPARYDLESLIRNWVHPDHQGGDLPTAQDGTPAVFLAAEARSRLGNGHLAEGADAVIVNTFYELLRGSMALFPQPTNG